MTTERLTRGAFVDGEGIEHDPRSGLVLIERGEPEYNLSVALWRSARPAWRRFAATALEESSPRPRNTPGPARSEGIQDWGIPVVVALVPEPDNEYNSSAISVRVPPTHQQAPVGPLLGYIRESHLRFLQDAIIELNDAVPGLIGCYCWLELDNDALDEEHPRALSKKRQRWHAVNLRLLLPPATQLQSLVARYVSACPDPPGQAHLAQELGLNLLMADERVDAPGPLVAVHSGHAIGVMNIAGVEIGRYWPDIALLTLRDERLRQHACQALLQWGLASPTARGADEVTEAGVADAILTEGDHEWLIRSVRHDIPVHQLPVIGTFDAEAKALRFFVAAHEAPLLALLRRHGVEDARAVWTTPSRDIQVRNLRATRVSPAGVDKSDPLFLLPSLRGLLPRQFDELLEVTWTPDAPEAAPGAITDLYPRPGPCILCGRPGGGSQSNPAAILCNPCDSFYSQGRLRDTGLDGSWTDATVYALRRLAEIEFHTAPSKRDLADLPHVEPEQLAECILLRLLIPRVAVPLIKATRPTRTWLEWLAAAELVAPVARNRRGVPSVAADGHPCRSLFERRVDDFMHHHRIAHWLEPAYPPHPELNPGGYRADWLLADGTFVEALGMMKDHDYAGKVEHKQELAEDFGLKLLLLYPDDQRRLADVFRPWLSNSQESKAAQAYAAARDGGRTLRSAPAIGGERESRALGAGPRKQ